MKRFFFQFFIVAMAALILIIPFLPAEAVGLVIIVGSLTSIILWLKRKEKRCGHNQAHPRIGP